MLTAKQECFVLELCKGASQSDAYRTAHPKSRMVASSIHQAASTLAAKPQVVERLAELRGRVAAVVVARTAYTREDAMREAEEARTLAHHVGQAGAAVAAVGLRAKLSDLLVEKRELRIGLLEDTDVDELLAIKARLREARAIENEVEDVEFVEVAEGNRPMIR